MEEILNKNIFFEKDLLVHSPDYSPKDILLKMQLRRDMARDSHRHGVLSCGPVKNIKKAKGSHKLKKEIVMLRDHFENMNLQNKSMLKDVERSLYKVKTFKNKKNLTQNDEDELIKNEMALYLNQSEEKVNLVIENDSDFKLSVKENNKIQNENVYRDSKYESNIPDSNKNVIQRNKNGVNKKNTSENEKAEINTSIPQLNEYKNDLKSLLIMMAINSNEDENIESEDTFQNVDQFDDKSSKNFPKSNQVYPNFEPSNQSIYPSIQSNTQSKELAQLLNIASIGKEMHFREQYITKKYFKKWKLHVIDRKEHRLYKQRQETINNFFDKLSKKKNNTTMDTEPVQKAKTFARDYNTYQHRYKVQKHIIALQKTKLEEQNKLIEQLKYNKIVEASRTSLDTMREDVRRTYYEIDRHLKPKIKCMTNELKIKEFDEPSLVLHCLKVPQFIQRMEARAREREEKHAMIRERRKQMEEERVKQKQQAELAKAEMDKEEKLRRIKELRDRRKKEKVENIRKKQHAERLRALIVMADLHYERNLMNKYGFKPLRRLIQIKRDNIEKARAHYRFQLLKNVFLHWMWYTEDMWFDRNYKADDFYRKKILKKYFEGFRKNHHEFMLKKQVAEDYYDLYVTQLVFKKFCEGIEVIKKENEMKLQKAIMYYNSNILFKTFTCWRTLPALNELKREQEARKLRWREKVLLVVPDYRPPED